MQQQEALPPWFARLSEVADVGRNTRRERHGGQRQTSRKITSLNAGYRNPPRLAEVSCAWGAHSAIASPRSTGCTAAPCGLSGAGVV